MEETPFTGPHHISLEKWISRAPFEKLLNMEIIEAEDGAARLSMPFYPEVANGGGLMHGGALVGLADTAAAMAIKSVVDPGTHFATISCSNEFLYPVTKGVVTAVARVADISGRTMEGEVVIYDDEGRQVMKFISIFKIARNSRVKNVVFGT